MMFERAKALSARTLCWVQQSRYKALIVLGIGLFALFGCFTTAGLALVLIGDPKFADVMCLLAAFSFPIPLIANLRWTGLLLGTIAMWGWLSVAGVVLSLLAARHAPIGDGFWMLIGWAPSLAYCALLLAGSEIAAWISGSGRSVGQRFAGSAFAAFLILVAGAAVSPKDARNNGDYPEAPRPQLQRR